MAKGHKHEEHVNHERWLVSFADMMTLLFALFVVLYAMSAVKQEKLDKLKESIQFAFHIEGDGKTQEIGVYDSKSGGGDGPEPAALVNAQDGPMKEFLSNALEDFEEATGTSLDIVISDDSIDLKAPLSKFFPPSEPYKIKPETARWLGEILPKTVEFSSDIRLVIESPDPIVGERNGRKVTAFDLCMERLKALRALVKQMPEIRPHMVRVEFMEPPERPDLNTVMWEDAAVVKIVLSTQRGQK